MGQSELIELEEQGWRALASTGEAAGRFCGRVWTRPLSFGAHSGLRG